MAMLLFRLSLCLFTAMMLLPLPMAQAAWPRPTAGIRLTPADQLQASGAVALAAKHPGVAAGWLRSQRNIASAHLGRDGRTIAIQFRDGAQAVILPTVQRAPAVAATSVSGWHVHAHLSSGSTRALVLEPFASQLQLGPTAGQDEVTALNRAGFQVDVLRDAQVTIGTMATLGAYGMVYFQTHAGVLPDGDAVVVTGEQNTAPYTELYREHSLLQAFVAGDDSKRLYNAITARFVTNHIERFPDHSIMFINGCGVLAAPLFWNALHQQNVRTLISWDAEVHAAANEAAGSYLTSRLASGKDVSTAINETRIEGAGINVVGDTVAHLGLLGDGAATLDMVSGRGPTPTPIAPATVTPTPTAVPTATRTSVPVVHAPAKKPRRCKPGHHRVHGKCRLKHK